jgi:hypothetical protein
LAHHSPLIFEFQEKVELFRLLYLCGVYMDILSYTSHQQSLFVLSFANFLKFSCVYVQAGEVVAGLASRDSSRSTVSLAVCFCSSSRRGGGTAQVAASVNQELQL